MNSFTSLPQADDVNVDKDSYLSELKNLVLLHARAQGLSPQRCRQLLTTIQTDGAGDADAWANVWSREAEYYVAKRESLKACRYYNLARFPFVDNAGRTKALINCVHHFQEWAATQGIRRLNVRVNINDHADAGQVGLWFKTQDKSRGKPLVLFIGGIVSVKEQWGQLLPKLSRLGMTVAATEMPGVGENTMMYDRDSWRMLPALLNELQAESHFQDVYLIALSFSGHLAMRAALHDKRICGILTVGAPISSFFSDKSWWRNLPHTTLRTLSHLTHVPQAQLQEHMAEWALTEQELSNLMIPIHYIASSRDEIIPAADPALLRKWVKKSQVIEYNDVHGSPHHLLEMRLTMVRALMEMSRIGFMFRMLLGISLGILRTGKRWTRLLS